MTLEVRVRIDRKVRTLWQTGDNESVSVICATIVASGHERVPYIPSRRYESTIDRFSIDKFGLRFPEKLKIIKAKIEPLGTGMFIDILFH